MKTVDGDDFGDADRAVHDATGHRIAIARAQLAYLVADLEVHPPGDDVAHLFVRMGVWRYSSVSTNRELDDHDVLAAGQHAAIHTRDGFNFRPFGAGVIRASS